MIMMEHIDVKSMLLGNQDFGPTEVARITKAISKGKYAEVRQNHDELKKRIGSNGDKRDLLVAGVVSYLLTNYDDAQKFLGQLPNDGMANYYRAHIFLALEDFAGAQDALKAAEKSGYDPVLCKLMQAGCIRQKGNLEEAEQLIRSVAREGATRAEYSYQMGCINSDRGDTYGALEYFERAVDMDPNHSRALFRLANLHNQLGNDDEAIRLYEQMLAKPPIYLGALLNLGLLYEDREQYGPAAFCFQRILETYPNHERARLCLKDIESSHEMYVDEESARRNKYLEQIMVMPITDFELSARSRNCLERANIGNLGDLTRTTEEQLLAGKNFGETSLKEIRAMLELHGLKLGQNLHQQRAQPTFRAEELTPEERAMHELLVGDLDLSVRARKCLTRLGVSTIGELLSRSADELLSVRNFGVTSLNEIRDRLRDKGLKLRGD